MNHGNEQAQKRLLGLLDGFLESKVLMTAFRLDVFTTLAAEPLARDALYARLDLPQRSGRFLVDACLALELLEEHDGRLHVPEALAPFVVRGDDRPFRTTTYLIDYYHEVYRALADMDELVRTDGAVSTFTLRDYFKEDVTQVDPQIAASYSQYMDATMGKIVDVVLATYDFSSHRYLLDLCGCTGTFCASVLEAHPGLRGGFIDVPACVEIGRRQLEDRPQVKDRIEPIAGDVFKTEFASADVITMCRSALDWGDEAILGVYQRAHRALPVGGTLLIIERMLPEEITPEAHSVAIRAIYFLAKSRTTRYRTVGEHLELLCQAGFEDLEVREPPRAPYEMFQSMRVIVARRSEADQG